MRLFPLALHRTGWVSGNRALETWSGMAPHKVSLELDDSELPSDAVVAEVLWPFW